MPLSRSAWIAARSRSKFSRPAVAAIDRRSPSCKCCTTSLIVHDLNRVTRFQSASASVLSRAFSASASALKSAICGSIPGPPIVGNGICGHVENPLMTQHSLYRMVRVLRRPLRRIAVLANADLTGGFMTGHAVSRRTAFRAATGAALLAIAAIGSASAEDKSITVGINLSLTGADAEVRQADREWRDHGVRRGQRQRRRQRLQDRSSPRMTTAPRPPASTTRRRPRPTPARWSPTRTSWRRSVRR